MLITSERLTCSTMLKLEAKIQKAPSPFKKGSSGGGGVGVGVGVGVGGV